MQILVEQILGMQILVEQILGMQIFLEQKLIVRLIVQKHDTSDLYFQMVAKTNNKKRRESE